MERFAACSRFAAFALCAAIVTSCAGRHAVRAAAIPEPDYSALGGGHLLRSASADGRYVTLEDGSEWEIEPSVRFQTMDWQRDAPMTVRRTQGIPPYVYELVNTQDDEGAMARLVRRLP